MLTRCKILYKLRFVIAVLSVMIVFVSSAYSQKISGGYGESFLLRDIGARPISMAGAYSAIVNEPTAIFYNPAGLDAFGNRPQFTSMYSILEFGRTHSALAWGQSFFENVGFGIGFNSYSTGSFTARDIMGNPIGDYTNWQFSLVGGASYSIEFASFGAAVKYLSNNLLNSGTCSDGVAIDIGSKFNIMNLFNFALAIQNVSGYMWWDTQSEEVQLLPFTIRTGIAMEYGLNEDSYITRSTVTGEMEEIFIPATRYILLGIDAIFTQHEIGPTVVMGVEAVPHEVIAFRGGMALLGDDMGEMKLFPMTVWGGGVSIRPEIEDLPVFFIDYSISADHLAANRVAHHIALFFEF
jgi:hypothetical protein